jgi:hypothetical protein
MNLYSFNELYVLANGQAIDTENLLTDFEKVSEKDGSGDQFFEKYGPGNTVDGLVKPYERMKAYEVLLKLLAEHNLAHFRAIHKGTPYYFLGWTAFQIEDYEKGVFYLDTAISEDLRLLGSTYDINSGKSTPGINFILLTGGSHVAAKEATELKNLVKDELADFSNKSGLTITEDIFIQKLIKDSGLFRDNTFRTIITSLYSFILEFESRQTQLFIRSSDGGSIEPFLTHLFKGCLILESLLKLLPPGDTKKTLKPAIEAHNRELGIDINLLPRDKTLEEVIALMRTLEQNKESYPNVCFATTYGLRNTTGHKLAWLDAFQKSELVYQDLYKRILGAIFWTVDKLWVE